MFSSRVCGVFARLALMLVGASVAPCTVIAQTLTWTGAAGNGYAGTAGNWSPSVTPTATHDLVIPAGAGTVNVNGVSVRNLSSASPLTNTSTSIFAIGSLTINGGTLNLTQGANFTIQGGADVATGIVFSGDCFVTGDGTITMAGNNFPNISFIDGTVDIAAGITINTSQTGVSPTQIAGNGMLINRGTIRSVSGLLTLGGTIQNQGEIAAVGGSVGFGYVGACCSPQSVTWTNTGTLKADGASSFIYLYNTGNQTGTFAQLNGGKVLIAGTRNNVTLGPRADGQTYYLASPSSNANSTFNNLTIAAPVVIANSNSLAFTGNLTFANDAQLDATNAIVQLSGVTLRGTGSIRDGFRVLSGDLNIAAGAVITMVAPAGPIWRPIRFYGQLINNGSLSFSGAANANFFDSTGTIVNNGVFSATNGTNLIVALSFSGLSGAVSASNNAIINFTGSTATLGTVSTSSGGQILINGVPPNNTITAPPEGLTINDTRTWNGVTLSGTFNFTACGQANITGGLTLAPGTVINLSGTTCGAPTQLNFAGTTPQTISGSGEIVAGAGAGPIRTESSLTIAPNVVVRTGAGNIQIRSTAGGTVTNQGTLRVSGAGAQIDVSPYSATPPLTSVNTGTLEVLAGATPSLSNDLSNTGTVTIGPGSTLTIPAGKTLTQTAAGTLTSQINGPNTNLNTGRLLLQGTFNAGGRARVHYVSYSPPALCRPAVLFVERLNAGSSITGNFTQFTLPSSTLPIVTRVRQSLPGFYFASSIVADVAAIGGNAVPDGQFTADDLIYFIDRLVSLDLGQADVAGLGGSVGPDGQITADDIIVYLNSAFAGCP